MNPKRKGETTEAVVISEMIKRGFDVSVPFGENTRYDLVLDNGKELKTVQCKTGRLKDNVVKFNTASTTSNYTETVEKDYSEQVDSFIVYCYENDGLYQIPIEEAPNSEMKLRLKKPKNNQKKGINWAKEYSLN